MPTYETSGEHLAAYLRDRHLGANPRAWDELEMVLLPTGRAEHWTAALREMTALHLTHQLIVAGTAIFKRQKAFDTVADRDIKQVIVDTMVVDYSVVNEISARLEPCVRATQTTVSASDRRAIKNQALLESPYCYLCASELTFDDPSTDPKAFTIDHVWPRGYGGESRLENLLAACRSCNERKGITPTWSIYPVQALVAGYELTDEKLAELPKEMRFAIQSRAAMQRAKADGTSLKEAFVAIGRPDIPSVVDPGVSVDVFNLTFSAIN